MKLNQEFNDYIETVYPDGIADFQKQELKKAFFAGCLSMQNLMVEASSLEENAAAQAINNLHLEIGATFSTLEDTRH